VNIAKVAGLNLSEIIEKRGTDAASRDRVFIINREDDDTLKEYTYRQFYLRSLEYGNMIQRVRDLQGKGSSKRFHVAVYMQNRPEFLFILGGCAFTNSTVVGINNAQAGEQLAFDINNTDVDMLIADNGSRPGTGRTFAGTVLEAGRRFGFTGLAREYIYSEGDTGEDMGTVGGLLERYNVSLRQFTPSELETGRPAVIIFTSGTTGSPKGIEVTWEKLVDVGITGTSILGYEEKDVGYVCMPLNHSNSLYLNVLPALMNGARIMLRRRFSSSNFVRDIRDSGATIWNTVGDPVHYVLNYLKGKPVEGLSGLPVRTVFSTGTNSTDRRTFSEVFGLEIFTEAYGSTEAGVVAAVDEGTPEYSVGKLIRDVRIIREGPDCREADYAEVDATGSIMNLDRAVGEVVVSQRSLGSSAFAGYYRLDRESSRRIMRIGGEDFYRMGDLGAVVRSGGEKYLIFLGRTGDWVRFKGENWAPVDAERIIRRYQGVRNAGVIGLPQSRGKEDDPMFIVETTDFEGFDIDGFYEYCRENLSRFMLPRFIRLMGSLPMTETMKLKKSPLKHSFIYRSPEIDEDPEDIIYEINESGARLFTTEEYKSEIERYTDPTNRDRLTAFTKRDDIFEDQS